MTSGANDPVCSHAAGAEKNPDIRENQRPPDVCRNAR